MTLTHGESLVRRHRFTVDDFHRMVEAGVLHEDDRVELLDGEVVVMPPIGDSHAACVRDLVNLLPVRVAGRAIVDAQNPLRLDEHSEPQPDITLLKPRPERYPAHPRPADVLLAIEVGESSVHSDRTIKAPLYARSGIQELWLIDLTRKEILVCRRPTTGGYSEITVRKHGDTLSPQALPELALRVEEILR